jgi:hypothetical protein
MKNLLAILLAVSLGVAVAAETPKKAETPKAAPAKKAEDKPEVKHHKKAEATPIPDAPAKK